MPASPPPNFSKNPQGYNTDLFKGQRDVRRAFMMLGYGVNKTLHRIPTKTVKSFQRDYNRCGQRFGHWGAVEVTGDFDSNTLNALEHAVRWSKKRENEDGMPSATYWQTLCRDVVECGESEDEAPVEMQTQYVEISAGGNARLRDIRTTKFLRAELLEFDREGDVIFATVKIPSQSDLRGGRDEVFRCPCVLER